MKKTVIIVQARMSATRLPGKPLKKVLEKPLLIYLIERLKRVKNADGVVIATTDKPEDQKIVEVAREEGVPFFCGSEENVLDRYYQAAKKESAEVIVRITGDCPLIDPKVIDKAIALFFSGSYDYVSNTLERTYPRGMDVEVFSFAALEKVVKVAKAQEELEHVTPFFYRHPELFQLGCLKREEDQSKHRLTVDTQEDFILVSRLIEHLYPENREFNLEDLLRVLQEKPEWETINSHITQKPLCGCSEDE